jgi:hypothetical protein
MFIEVWLLKTPKISSFLGEISPVRKKVVLQTQYPNQFFAIF